MTSPEQVVLAARTWIGTPYVHQARGPKGPSGGVDCVGLLIGVSIELGGIEEGYDPTGYSWETDGTQLRTELAKWSTSIWTPQSEVPLLEILEPGDIAIFEVAGIPHHTGIISEIDYGTSGKELGLIHASRPFRSVIEHRLDLKWTRRLIEVWRLNV